MIGCSKRTGRRRILWRPTIKDDEQDLEAYVVLALKGTRVLAVDAWADHITNSSATLVLDDAARDKRKVELARSFALSSFPAARLRADGTVAWLQRESSQMVLRLRTVEGAVREIDQGTELTKPQLDGPTLRWTHGDAPRTAPVAPPDACPGVFADGTQELGVAKVRGVTVLCARATGHQVSLPSGGQLVMAGTRAALTGEGEITVVAVDDGTMDSVSVSRLVKDVAVSASGALAWTTWDFRTFPRPPEELWVRDRAGVRRIAVADSISAPAIDTETLSWMQSGQQSAQHLELVR